MKREGSSYFITFRLFDSLPAEVIVRLRRDREAIVEQARAAKRPLSWSEEQQLFIMPNHVHVMVRPLAPHTLSEIEHSWKSFTANQTNEILQRRGTFWQKESYDHCIRNDEEHARLSAYVINNPVKARLCSRPEDWAWSSAGKQAGPFKESLG